MTRILLILLLLPFQPFAQCAFNGSEVNAGTIAPTGSVQSIGGVSNGDYFVLNATCGTTYLFETCGNTSWDTQITVLNTSNVSQAYNDDGCSLQSSVSWTANSNMTVYILITEYYCNLDGTFNGMDFQYSVTGSSSYDASFTLSSNGCSGVTANITGDTGGTFTFNPAPGDGASINSSTGEISNGVPGNSYTVEYTVACGVSSTQSITLPASGDASFSLNASCGGAVPIISGDQGGTFSFNPAPGDGAQISATSGVVSNATAGNTYYVEYTICGSSTTESVTVIDDDCFTLNNDAQYITVNGEQCIQLTAAANNQTGCAWNGNQIDFNNDFSLNLDYYFGSNTGGADGTTFTFQPSSSTACGVNGSQLGGGGISNSLVIEFDTYDNDGGSSNDLSCDHIAVEVDGDLPDDPSYFPANQPPLEGPYCAKSGGGNIDDGNVYAVEIDWNAGTQTLSVYFDGNLRLTLAGYDVVNNVFGGQSQVYWGATAATGGLNNQQYFCPSTVVILPVELNSFYSECTEEREVFYWESESEINLKSYDLEYTYDGIVFYPVKSVEAVGTTDQKTQYSVSVESNDQDMRYYRLKMHDIDGRVETSELIASKSCHENEGGIIHTVAQASNEITVNLKEIGELMVFDAFGKMVYISSNQLAHHIDTQEFSNGVYVIKVIDAEGSIRDTRKLMLAN